MKMYNKNLRVFLLLLSWSAQCWTKRVVVNLADGRTSRPILLYPLEHDHHKEEPGPAIALPIPEALQQDDPFDLPAEIDQPGESDKNGAKARTTIVPNNNQEVSNTQTTEINEEEVVLEDTKPLLTKSPSTTTTTTTTQKSITTTTPSTTPTTKTTTQPTTPPPPQPTITHPAATSTGPTPTPTTAPCHQSCLRDLNATRLYSNDTLHVPRGSDLTLICELPLSHGLTIEKLIWLFHPAGSPEGQCSLTTQRYLNSCPGFTTVSNTDDRNATFLRQILTLADLRENHTGEYMCQVEATCCQGLQEEHPMSQELTIGVSVWKADYTLDLAVAGSLAAVLLVTLIGVSIWLDWRQRRAYFSLDGKVAPGKTTSTVLHLPLIDDDDDSFDSNSDGQA